MGVEPAGRCETCGHEIVTIGVLVDGADLEMYSCDNCDTRTWQRKGVAIDLADVLDEVGEQVGRRS